MNRLNTLLNSDPLPGSPQPAVFDADSARVRLPHTLENETMTTLRMSRISHPRATMSTLALLVLAMLLFGVLATI